MDPIRHLFVLSLLSACSLGISGPSPDRPRREVPKCDTGKGLVAADGVFAAASGLAGIAAASEGSGEVGGVLALVGTAFVLSAVHGNTKANACREEFVKFTLETPPGLDVDDDDERERIARQAGGRLPRPAAFQPSAPLPQKPPVQPERRPSTEQVAPEPPPVAAPAPPAAKEPPAKQPAQQTDDWHDFWQEVP